MKFRFFAYFCKGLESMCFDLPTFNSCTEEGKIRHNFFRTIETPNKSIFFISFLKNDVASLQSFS